ANDEINRHGAYARTPMAPADLSDIIARGEADGKRLAALDRTRFGGLRERDRGRVRTTLRSGGVTLADDAFAARFPGGARRAVLVSDEGEGRTISLTLEDQHGQRKEVARFAAKPEPTDEGVRQWPADPGSQADAILNALDRETPRIHLTDPDVEEDPLLPEDQLVPVGPADGGVGQRRGVPRAGAVATAAGTPEAPDFDALFPTDAADALLGDDGSPTDPLADESPSVEQANDDAPIDALPTAEIARPESTGAAPSPDAALTADTAADATPANDTPANDTAANDSAANDVAVDAAAAEEMPTTDPLVALCRQIDGEVVILGPNPSWDAINVERLDARVVCLVDAPLAEVPRSVTDGVNRLLLCHLDAAVRQANAPVLSFNPPKAPFNVLTARDIAAQSVGDDLFFDRPATPELASRTVVDDVAALFAAYGVRTVPISSETSSASGETSFEARFHNEMEAHDWVNAPQILLALAPGRQPWDLGRLFAGLGGRLLTVAEKDGRVLLVRGDGFDPVADGSLAALLPGDPTISASISAHNPAVILIEDGAAIAVPEGLRIVLGDAGEAGAPAEGGVHHDALPPSLSDLDAKEVDAYRRSLAGLVVELAGVPHPNGATIEDGPSADLSGHGGTGNFAGGIAARSPTGEVPGGAGDRFAASGVASGGSLSEMPVPVAAHALAAAARGTEHGARSESASAQPGETMTGATMVAERNLSNPFAKLWPWPGLVLLVLLGGWLAYMGSMAEEAELR
ncbi:MAG: hypothetical protein AAGF49_14055, partial [Pseudomonadota bacterium]